MARYPVNWFKRRPKARPPIDLTAPVDVEAAKKAAAAVNRGDSKAANKICNATANPRATAFAAFRWIDPADE